MYIHGANTAQIERKYGINKKELLDFSCNTNPLAYPPVLEPIIIENIKSILEYPDIEYYQAKKAISEYTGVDADYILPGNGAVELIHLYAHLTRPEKALIAAPTFCEYEKSLVAAGCCCSFFERKAEDNFCLDTDLLAAELEKKYDLFVVCNPNNPTSSLSGKEQLLKIIQTAEKTDTMVMIDESFIDFTGENNSVLSCLDKKNKNVFILRSMTKFFSIPGLRLGYGILFDKDLYHKISESRFPWSINTFSALAAEKLYLEKEYIRRTIELLKTEKDFLFRELQKIPHIKAYPPSVNYILFRLENGMLAHLFQEKLLAKNILIRDASNFKFLDRHYVRTAVKDREKNQILLHNIREILSS